MSCDGRHLTAATITGLAAAAAAVILWVELRAAKARVKSLGEAAPPAPAEESSSRAGSYDSEGVGRYSGKAANQRSKHISTKSIGRWTRPVVISGPGLTTLRDSLRKRLGSEEFPESEGPTVSVEKFKSNDPNVRFNWQRVVGRKIIFLFDTVDQAGLFEQLALLQALQGFAVPDGDDKASKWKTYVDSGRYSWGRASHITVVLPWYRPCQMERTSRWHLSGGKWINDDAEGQWLDCPTAQYMARLLTTPGSVPPLPGPSAALDGESLDPLWRPPVELLFVELHEELPIVHSVSDLEATIRTERFVPYFLGKFKARESYVGAQSMYVVCPDIGAYKRYLESVIAALKLDLDHMLFIKKTRVGEQIGQVQKLFYEDPKDQSTKEKASFKPTDHVLILDDFTNSGSTLFGAVNLLRSIPGAGPDLSVTIFVSHLVAVYDPKVVASISEKLTALGPKCSFYTTNTIPSTTNLLSDHPQVRVFDVADFIADMVTNQSR